MESAFKPDDVIFVYTSAQAAEDGDLFDLDTILARKVGSQPLFLKYITAGLLAKGYWNDKCKNGVPNGQQGKDDRCPSCDVFMTVVDRLSCLNDSLNRANLFDLINQAGRIFRKKPLDDYFVSGTIELPAGSKQKIFIAQNETGRYTAMLPEEY